MIRWLHERLTTHGHASCVAAGHVFGEHCAHGDKSVRTIRPLQFWGCRLVSVTLTISTFWFFTPYAYADAIAFDQTTDLTQTTGTSLTYSATVSTGSNMFLVVGVRTSGTVSSVTYNGATMTQGAFSNGSGGSGVNNYLFYLLSPSTGTHNVVVTMASSIDIASAAWSYSGVGGVDVSNTAVANASSITLTFTTTKSGDWLAAYGDNGGGGYSVTTGTLRNPIAGGNSKFGLDSGAAEGAAGSYSLKLTSSGSQGWTLAGIAFYPATASTPSNFGTLTFFGWW